MKENSYKRFLKVTISICIISFLTSCKNDKTALKNTVKEITKSKIDTVKLNYYANKVNSFDMYSQDYQKYLDSLIIMQPNFAYLWQQKAMPLFKSKKYEVGMTALDKAIEINPEEYLDYRAFIKCIFSKQYKSAIEDFKTLKSKRGNAYVMDHSYDFYLGLCHLQLNEIKIANTYFKNSIDIELEKFSEEWISTSEWFYLGVSYFELKQYDDALIYFDKALKYYPNFGDVKYYKFKTLNFLDNSNDNSDLLREAYNDILNGGTVNEANAMYERYPYQVYKEQLEYLVNNPK